MRWMRKRAARFDPIFTQVKRPTVEALEERQMLTLFVDVRAADGSKTVTASAVGQVVNLQVWAEVTDPQNDPQEDGFQAVFASFLSTGVGPSSPIAGNLSATLESAFTASGSSAGTSQDLNGDGNLDVGSDTPTSATGFFYARSGSALASTSPGAVIGTVGSNSALEFEIGTLAYTVTSLAGGGETDINFRPRPAEAGEDPATWFEDLNAVDPSANPAVAGAPVRILAPAPVANTASVSAIAGVATTIDLASDVQSVPGIDPASVQIVTPPTQGTAAVNSDGTITYTPSLAAAGADSISYQLKDTNGLLSNVGVIELTVTPANTTPPTTVSDSATALSGQASAINIGANDTAALPIADYTPLLTQPAHGTVVASSPFDGSVNYTPSAGFVGQDSFTYTLAVPGGGESNTSTVNVAVGVALSQAKGGVRTLSVLNGRATVMTTTLAGPGTADVYFAGDGVLSERAGPATVAPAAGQTVGFLGTLSLSGTTFGTTLSVGGSATLQNVTDATPLGRLVAPAATIDGTLNLGGLSLLQVAAINTSTLTLGSAANAAGLTVRCGPFASSTFSTEGTLTLQAGAVDDDTIATPDARLIRTSAIANSNLSSTGSGARAQIVSTGAIQSSTLSAAGDSLVLSAASLQTVGIAAAAAPSIALRGDAVDLSLQVSGSVGVLSAAGLDASAVTAGSISTMHVVGAVNATTLSTTGNLANLIAGSLSGDLIGAGIAPTALASATAGGIGAASIGNVRLTSRAANFSGTAIVAHNIGSLSLGEVSTSNAGTPNGVAAASIRLASFEIDGAGHRLNAAALASPTVFGDFEIELLG